MPTANGSTARTGRLGKAVVDSSLVYRLTKWTINPKSGESTWGDSDSGGYTNRAGTRKDCTGSITGKFDEDRTPYSLLREGDRVELVLWENASDYWAFPHAVISSFNLTYDQDSQEVVEWSADFGSDGVYYAPGEAGAPTHTLPTS